MLSGRTLILFPFSQPLLLTQAKMSEALETAIAAALGADNKAPPRLAYGTAGFRAKHDVLDAAFFRMGLLAGLRAIQKGAAVGVMITASHNPIEDNGLKMIDSDGGMLVQTWEKHATELAAAHTASDIVSCLEKIARAEGVAWPLASSSSFAKVMVGRDTRPSSERLTNEVKKGAGILSSPPFHVACKDMGLLTTPQLHHLIRMTNLSESGADPQASQWASIEGYHRLMTTAYREILCGAEAKQAERGPLYLDCAHGIGGPQARLLQKAFSEAGLLSIDVRNAGDTPDEASRLNDGVGAEHCQKERKPPSEGFTPAADFVGKRCASLDGDADRLVYWRYAPGSTSAGAPEWRLLDGDKIACLAAAFLADQLTDLGLAITDKPTHSHGDVHDEHHAGSAAALDEHAPVSVGVVQTAYANGASTAYIRSVLKLPVVWAKTGVKYVHHAALSYDLGVYFEANGHGTVLIHPQFLDRLNKMDESKLTSEKQRKARSRLIAASRLINQAIGDALSDAMFVEAVLALKGWSAEDWDGIYADLPSRQAKLAVPDRSAVTTNADETRVLSPKPLQDAIDAAVSKYGASGRAFVRPSGTEDVVRVYAEASTQEEADRLAGEVVAAVKAVLCSGASA